MPNNHNVILIPGGHVPFSAGAGKMTRLNRQSRLLCPRPSSFLRCLLLPSSSPPSRNASSRRPGPQLTQCAHDLAACCVPPCRWDLQTWVGLLTGAGCWYCLLQASSRARGLLMANTATNHVVASRPCHWEGGLGKARCMQGGSSSKTIDESSRRPPGRLLTPTRVLLGRAETAGPGTFKRCRM
ncbi:hypothetical protein LX36DRAFT_33611 [Colletotrichum falcatum]|nr:hypothetical protein LX36DRAFT_33611 [Colletotrichum falcatum]